MNKIRIFQVDAFAERLFSGNPAAVCLLEEWLNDEILQSIAAENNLAETAYLVPKEKGYQIRWFTPTIEVDLCGHATLAAAFVLFDCLESKGSEVIFHSPKSGKLRVFKQQNIFFLDFPTDKLKAAHDNAQIRKCIGVETLEMYRGKTDYLVVVESEEIVQKLIPDFKEISKLPVRGLIVTAKGNDVDFVSRFFAPQSGIEEDPVTGSAHTSLIPYWSGKLDKKEMSAKQLSKRGGKLICIDKGERSFIGGEARLYLTGDIHIG